MRIRSKMLQGSALGNDMEKEAGKELANSTDNI